MKNNFPTEDYSVNAIDLQQADISKEEILEIYWDYVNIIPQLKSQAQHYANLLQLGNKINSGFSSKLKYLQYKLQGKI